MTGLPSNFGGPHMAMSEYYQEDYGEEEEDEDNPNKNKMNRVPFHGNDKTMNMNPLILANVQNSPYFKTDLLSIKTYHEVVDEIYYKVDHLEPWERGTRKTAGMSHTGMCGGVRGVSAGGVVSSAFCLLFKLHTIRLTKKQAYGLLNHRDSPYIRALGFMYLRFTLPPGEMWQWFQPYIEDEEEIDIKAGGGKAMTMGEFCRMILTRLEWFETRFPRIAVTAEKQIRAALEERMRANREPPQESRDNRVSRERSERSESTAAVDERSKRSSASREKSHRSNSRSKKRSRSRDKKRSRSRSRDRKKKKKSRSKSRDRRRSRSRDKHSKKKHKRSRSRSRDKKRRDKDRNRDSYEEELRQFKELKKSRRSRSRSRDRR